MSQTHINVIGAGLAGSEVAIRLPNADSCQTLRDARCQSHSSAQDRQVC